MATLIFDFDGTLADSLSAIVTISNRLAPEFGYRQTPPEAVDRLRGLSARQLIRYSGISVFKIPALLRRLRAELRQQTIEISPCSGIPAVIHELHKRHTLAIITSNTPDIVGTFLATHSLQPYFVGVEGGGTLFGKGRLIRKSLQQRQYDPDTTLYIGDEVRDIEAARAAGVRSVAVTWGFNSREVLAAAEPDWLIDKPEILQAIADTV